MGGEQAEPQSAHSSVSLVGGLAPHTTFKGIPLPLEEAAADTRFLAVPLSTLVETKLPV